MQQEIRFATFNVCNLAPAGAKLYDNLEPLSPAQYDAKAEWTARQIDLLDADVIGFQEIFSQAALRDVLSRTRHYRAATLAGHDAMDAAGRMLPTVALVSRLPEGPKYFPDDMMTDQPERLICAEMIREKALLHLRDEVPHGIGVEMMAINKLSDNLTEIHATIYCERASHKGIIIGKQGAMLRTIGAEARRDIENLLGTKVNLQLWVKIREDWRNRMDDLRTLGYESN